MTEVSPTAIKVEQGGPRVPVMMLTSDISLLHDPEYTALVQRFAADSDAFDAAFSAAWYKLTTRDMGPHTRCIGAWSKPPIPGHQPPRPPLTGVPYLRGLGHPAGGTGLLPPPQPWQFPLPPPPVRRPPYSCHPY